MDEHGTFAVIFIYIAMFGAYIAMFYDVGGFKILGDKLYELIESHIHKRNKKKDI